MKRFTLFITFIALLCCCNNKTQISNNTDKQELTEDSIGKWYAQHYSQFDFCIATNKGVKAKCLNDSIIIAFMENVYPKVHNAMSGVVDDIDSYKNISAYIGTDGFNWIVYDKFRSKVNGSNKIQYFKYDSTLPEKHQGAFCEETDFPDNWKDLVSTVDNTPAPYPSELENIIFNKCDDEMTFDKDNNTIMFRGGDIYFYVNNIFQKANITK